MPFFLPKRLIDFEYFEPSVNNPDYDREAEPYRKDIGFAFFAVNFGYSKADYEALTPREIAFIYKAWENKKVADSLSMYNSVFTAVFNANRSKKQRALKLWKKRNEYDENVLEENKRIIEQTEKNDGDWISKIYKANNLKLRKGGDI